MINPQDIREHTEVVGSDGSHVGTVDHLEGGDRIKLTKKDPEAQGEHHYIPVSWVESVDGGQVRLNKSADEARQQWQSEGAAGASGDSSNNAPR